MGFVSTIAFLIVLGFLIQAWYKKSLRVKWKDSKYFLGTVIISGILIVQVLVYYDVIPLPTLLSNVFPWIPVQSGRTWLWNSWQCVGATPSFIMPPGAGQFAVVMASSYPLWYMFGIWVGKCVFGNRTFQRGALWLFQSDKGAAPAPRLDPAGEEGATK